MAPRGQTRNLRRAIRGNGGLSSGRAFAYIVCSMRYAQWVEFGADPHIIRAVNRKCLRWIPKGGRITGKTQISVSRGGLLGKIGMQRTITGGKGYRFAKFVNHPGNEAMPFFFNTIDANMRHLTPLIWKNCSRHLRLKA